MGVKSGHHSFPGSVTLPGCIVSVNIYLAFCLPCFEMEQEMMYKVRSQDRNQSSGLDWKAPSQQGTELINKCLLNTKSVLNTGKWTCGKKKKWCVDLVSRSSQIPWDKTHKKSVVAHTWYNKWDYMTGRVYICHNSFIYSFSGGN